MYRPFFHLFPSIEPSFNSLHQSDRTAVWTGGFISCAVVPSCGNNSGFNSLLLGWSFRIPEASGIKSKVYSQSFLAAICGQHYSFPRQCGYQWRSMKWQECGLTGFFKRKQPTNLNPSGAPGPQVQCCVKAVLGGAFKKKQPFWLRSLRSDG